MTINVIFFEELNFANSALVGGRSSGRCEFLRSIKLRYLPLSSLAITPKKSPARPG
jgi:hypothetical protein